MCFSFPEFRSPDEEKRPSAHYPSPGMGTGSGGSSSFYLSSQRSPTEDSLPVGDERPRVVAVGVEVRTGRPGVVMEV